MRRIGYRALKLACAVLFAGALALALGFAATGGRHRVPPTVRDDASLPQVRIDGVRLHVRTYGAPNAPPVIVVHGGPGQDFRALLPLAALADRYRVVFYDQRGSGLSERVPDERLTLDGLLRELDGVVERYGGGRPVRLIGHSWGAMLLSAYVGRHPEKVAQAVLAEPGFLTPETGRRFLRATHGMRPPWTLEVLRVGATAWLRSLHVDGPDDDARADYLAGALVRSRFAGHPMEGYFCGRDLGTARMEGWRARARVSDRLLASAFDEHGELRADFTRGLERFPRTVLLLAGSCGTVVGVAQQRAHLRHFRRARLEVIEGAGHTMFGEKPVESVAAVRRYLEASAAEAEAEVADAARAGAGP